MTVHLIWGAVCCGVALLVYIIQRCRVLHANVTADHYKIKIDDIKERLNAEREVKKHLGVLSQTLMKTLKANEKWYRNARIELKNESKQQFEHLSTDNAILDAKLKSLLERTDNDPTDRSPIPDHQKTPSKKGDEGTV